MKPDALALIGGGEMLKDRDEIDELIKFATAFARKKLRGLPDSLTGDPAQLAHDFAQSAFEKLVRDWYPEKCHPKAFLSVCIKHELDALLRRHETSSIEYGYPENVVLLRDPHQSQDEKIQLDQQRAELLNHIGACHSEARVAAELILDHDGEITRAELARLMKVSPSHVDYLKKCLKKSVIEFLKEVGNSESPANRILCSMNGEQR